ncbi:MAG: hypothetical protein ACXWQQ_01515 [Pseudobdellovibrio sp.]
MQKHNVEEVQHLVAGKVRSYLDWKNRVGHLFDVVKGLGGLEAIRETELDSTEGLFDLGFGPHKYKIELSSAGILAMPIDGGKAVPLANSDNLFYRARPEVLARQIISANLFTETTFEASTHAKVFFAERKIDEKVFLLVICFDSKWFESTANQGFIKAISENYIHIIVLSTTGVLTLPFLISNQIHISQAIIPLHDEKLLISRKFYCDEKFGISRRACVALFPEKKMIIFSDKIFILGIEINLKVNSYPYKYLTGLCDIVGDGVPSKHFANKYLQFHGDDHDSVVTKARNEAKNALKKAFNDQETYKIAESLCMPVTDDKFVKSGFKSGDFVILDS